jgi:predicted RNA-binding protein with PUA-like domain
MAWWLLKTEPSEYSFADLVREQRTRWSGVANPTAVRHLGEMKAGDEVVIYHTGGEKRAVGLASVTAAGAEPEVAAGAALAAPVGLDVLKAAELFADSPLVRIGRLSVVPLSAAQYRFILKAGKSASR